MNKQDDTTAVFELFDSTLADITPELLGLWVTQPTDHELAFGVESQPAADVPLWRSRFPADLTQADDLLIRNEARLKHSQAVLHSVPGQLNRLLQQSHARGTEDVSFDWAATEQSLTLPEQELLTALQDLQDMDQPQSFGLDVGGGGALSRGWNQASEQFQAFMNRVLSVIANYAWVETQVEGQTVARTALGWTGGMNSVWLKGVSVEHQRLHQRSLALTLASRQTLLEHFKMAVQLATRVSLAMSLPGGAILALPAVWRFINQIIHKTDNSALA